MTGGTALIAFIVAVVLVVLISEKFKCNIGIIGFLAAYILGVGLSGYSHGKIAGFFPSSIFITQLTVTFFFGFVVATGVFKGIGDRVIYKCRNRPWAVPIITFIASYVVGLLGAGNEATPLVISPLAFAFAAEAGFNPVIAAAATYFGACWGGSLPWTSGALLFGICQTAIGEADGTAAMWACLIGLFFIFIIMFLFTYFFFGGHKIKTGVTVKAPEPFTPKQKNVLLLVIIVIAILIIPSITNTLIPNPLSAWLVRKADIRLVCLLGALVCLFMRVSDPREVLLRRVPWGLLTMLAGMCTLMNVAGSMGVVDMLGDWLGSSVSAALLPAAFCLLGGLLSFITNGLTLWPLFTAMVPALSVASGLSPILLCCVAMCGTFPSGFSPISTGGAMATIGASDEIRTKIFWRQMAIAGFGVVINIVFALVGGYTLIVNILV